MSEEKPTWIEELAFGQEMLLWDYKGTYPLEAVTVIEYTDDDGIFYLPGIPDYVNGKTLVTGNRDGYESREQLMRCVGRAWDKAIANRLK